MNPGKMIHNIITCDEEVGSGTVDAAGGRFFSPIDPIPGYTSHMKMGGASMGDPVLGLAETARTFAIPAREASGDVVKSNPKVEELLEQCVKDGAVPILHSVFGSKTGIT